MNYYQHHIGDFNNATRHLTRIERSIYRDMVELYYDTEKPLPLDVASICRKVMARSEEEKSAVLALLDEFFVESPEGYRHERCEEEIANALDAMVEAQDRRQNEKERQRRNRERRAELFTQLRAYDEVPAWNISTEALVSRVQYHLSRVTGPDSAVTQHVQTAPATANHYPLPNTHLPLPTTQYPEEDKDTVVVSPPADEDDVRKCPVGTLVDLYHELMPGNPRVKVLGETRKAMIRQRWKEAATLECSPFGYKTRSEGLAAWREFFEICATSPFLLGLSRPQPDRPAFIADIDFIFKPTKFASILENKYHRE